MRVRKTRQEQRNVYRYPVDIEDGRGGYKRTYTTIKPGEDGVTEVMIRTLHQMDDNCVNNNIKNARPGMSEEQKAAQKVWEEEHPGESYQANWNLSLDYVIESEECDTDKGGVYAMASYEMEEEVPYDVLKLREIVETKMTARQKQAYELIGLQGYSKTEAAGIMGVAIKVVWTHYDKAIECIKKYF